MEQQQRDRHDENVIRIIRRSIEDYNTLRRLLMDLETLARAVKTWLHQFHQRLSHRIVVEIRESLPCITANEIEPPYSGNILDGINGCLIPAEHHKVLSLLWERSTRQLLEISQGLNEPMAKTLYKLHSANTKMTPELNLRAIRETDLTSVSNGFQVAAECLDRIKAQQHKTSHHLDTILQPFIADADKMVAREEVERYENATDGEKIDIFKGMLQMILLSKTTNMGADHADFQDAVDKFTTFSQLEEIQELKEQVAKLQEYNEKLFKYGQRRSIS